MGVYVENFWYTPNALPLGPNCLANWLANQNVGFPDTTKTTWPPANEQAGFQSQQNHMLQKPPTLPNEAWHNADEASLVGGLNVWHNTCICNI